MTKQVIKNKNYTNDEILITIIKFYIIIIYYKLIVVIIRFYHTKYQGKNSQ